MNIARLAIAWSCMGGAVQAAVATSVPPYLSIVEELSEGAIQANSIVPEGGDPHTFSPTPAQCAALDRADVILLTGEPFEFKLRRWMDQRSKALILDLSKIGGALPSPCNHGEHRHRDQIDTHLWLSPKRLEQQCQLIATALAQRFPTLRSTVERNALHLVDRLQRLDEQLQEVAAKLPGRALLVSHPALTYFCADYHLHQLSTEIEGRDPTPREQTRLLGEIRDRRIDRILIFKPHSERAALQLAQQLQLRVVALDPYSRDPLKTLQLLSEGLRG